ncbi:Ca2+ regulator and membrane fusion protein Fig1-domain-containing protein [Lipomyces orientalis]|uniref:Ca2+ regulator and membrane fusion protein Fig1-domain-containing protein n=1 Tax=Lipomyces orientalis TaxID=1233043 RepID=A0ACC3TPA1_9ASCO
MIFWLVKKFLPKSAKKPHPTRSLRFFIVVFLFITVFLLLFSILGSSSTASTYSSVFAVKFSLTSSSNQTISVQSGYYGLCATSNSTITCTSVKNTTALDSYRSVKSSSGAKVDLVSLAELVSEKIIHPTLIISSLVFVIVGFFSGCARLIIDDPESWYASILNSSTLWSCILATVLWGMGVAWSHVSANTLALVLYDSTSGAISATLGKKLDAMGWTAFAFLLQSTGAVVICVALDARHAADNSASAEQKGSVEDGMYTLPSVGHIYAGDNTETKYRN